MSYELTTTLKVLTNLIKLRLNLQVAEIASSNVVKMVFDDDKIISNSIYREVYKHLLGLSFTAPMGYNASTSTYIYLTRASSDTLIRIGRRYTDRELCIEDMSSIYSLYRQLCDLSSKYFADSYTGEQTFILPKDDAAQLIQSLQTDAQYRVITDVNKFKFTKNRIEIKFFIRANFVKVLL
jgi:hypothetical protein